MDNYYDCLARISERKSLLLEMYDMVDQLSIGPKQKNLLLEIDQIKTEYERYLEIRNEYADVLQVFESELTFTEIPKISRIRNGKRYNLVRVPEPKPEKDNEAEESDHEAEAEAVERPTPGSVVHFTPAPICLRDLANTDKKVDQHDIMFAHNSFDEAIINVHEGETIYVIRKVYKPSLGLLNFNEDNVSIIGVHNKQLIDFGEGPSVENYGSGIWEIFGGFEGVHLVGICRFSAPTAPKFSKFHLFRTWEFPATTSN